MSLSPLFSMIEMITGARHNHKNIFEILFHLCAAPVAFGRIFPLLYTIARYKAAKIATSRTTLSPYSLKSKENGRMPHSIISRSSKGHGQRRRINILRGYKPWAGPSVPRIVKATSSSLTALYTTAPPFDVSKNNETSLHPLSAACSCAGSLFGRMRWPNYYGC